MSLTVTPEIQSVVRSLSPEEFKQLEENVLRDGVREPLSVWQSDGKAVLLDGHNRYRICTTHNLPYDTVAVTKVTLGGVEQPLDSVNRARIWVVDNQKGRRNLDTNDWASLVAAVVPDFAEEAKRRQIETLKANAQIGGQAKAAKAKGLPSLNFLSEGTNDSDKPTTLKQTKAVENANLAVQQAIDHIAPDKTNRTYVAAVLKEAGYDAKKNVFKAPEKVTQVGSAPGQTKVADLVKQQRQQAVEAKLSKITSENATKLPADKRYSVLYVDCPWQYDDVKTDNRKIENHYPTMPVEELCKFTVEFDNGHSKPVTEIAADDAILFFWATAPMLPEALKVIESWGFQYKSHAVWDKEKMGMGYWFRGQHELLLVAIKGKMPTPGEYARVSSVIRAPRGEHSAKPEVVYDIIEKMYPKASYVELFSRSKRDGWDSVGNQLPALESANIDPSQFGGLYIVRSNSGLTN